jgi:hypothetical protein
MVIFQLGNVRSEGTKAFVTRISQFPQPRNRNFDVLAKQSPKSLSVILFPSSTPLVPAAADCSRILRTRRRGAAQLRPEVMTLPQEGCETLFLGWASDGAGDQCKMPLDISQIQVSRVAIQNCSGSGETRHDRDGPQQRAVVAPDSLSSAIGRPKETSSLARRVRVIVGSM